MFCMPNLSCELLFWNRNVTWYFEESKKEKQFVFLFFFLVKLFHSRPGWMCFRQLGLIVGDPAFGRRVESR